MGVQACAAEADLSDPAVIPTLFDLAESALGPIEVLVNNAAHWEADTFLPRDAELSNNMVELWADRPPDITAASFDRIFSVDTRAPVLMMAEFARRHIARGSLGPHCERQHRRRRAFSVRTTYGAAKFALESYTRSAAVELGRFGITVNVLSLGPCKRVGSLRTSNRQSCRPFPSPELEAPRMWRT